MPAIKKKWIKTNREEDSLLDEDAGKNNEEERETDDFQSVSSTPPKPVKRNLLPGSSTLRHLDGEVLLEKRKRFIPPAELKLSEWLDNNLEKRTKETVQLMALYKYYTELCQSDGSEILDVPAFNKMVKVKFGKAFGVQPSSIYKTLIKERTIGEKKKGGGIKLKEIVIEAINHFGNPWNGVRFNKLKQYVGAQCPALQLDVKPKVLKRALDIGVACNYIYLTKGIGMAGSYRLPGAIEPPPVSKVKSKKVEDAEGGEEVSKSADKEDGSGDAKEDDSAKKDNESGKDEEHKPKKPKKIQTWSYSKISFSEPARVEDTFPLAITYQSAPKAVSVGRIRRYISEKYGEEIVDNRLRKALENGLEKGNWELVSGSLMSGRLLLLMDDFDPSSDNLEDRICAAIIACHEPKSAAATTIKRYISKYHSEFSVDERPDKFKKALQRALEKKMIRQLSGIGATGTFQLVVPFTPSPTVLAGEDDSEEEDEGYDEENVAYVPRGTKSRGMPKLKTMEVVRSKARKTVSSSPSGRGSKKVSNKSSKGKTDKKGVVEKKKSNAKKLSGRSKSSKANKRAPSPLTDEEEEEEQDSEPEYSPRKSQSRGGDSRQATPSKSKSAKKVGQSKKASSKPTSKSPQRKRKAPDSDDEDEEEVVPLSSRKSTSRGSGSTAKSSQNGLRSPSRTPKKKAKKEYLDEGEESEEEEPEYSPRKSQSRGGGSSRQATPSKGKSTKKGRTPKQRAPSPLTEEEDDEEPEYSPKKSRR